MDLGSLTCSQIWVRVVYMKGGQAQIKSAQTGVGKAFLVYTIFSDLDLIWRQDETELNFLSRSYYPIKFKLCIIVRYIGKISYFLVIMVCVPLSKGDDWCMYGVGQKKKNVCIFSDIVLKQDISLIRHYLMITSMELACSYHVDDLYPFFFFFKHGRVWR